MSGRLCVEISHCLHTGRGVCKYVWRTTCGAVGPPLRGHTPISLEERKFEWCYGTLLYSECYVNLCCRCVARRVNSEVTAPVRTRRCKRGTRREKPRIWRMRDNMNKQKRTRPRLSSKTIFGWCCVRWRVWRGKKSICAGDAACWEHGA